MHNGENIIIRYLLTRDTNCFFFSPGNWKSNGNAVMWMVFYGQLQRERYWLNKIQASGEISYSCSEDKVT